MLPFFMGAVMAGPVALITKAGRTIYKSAKGRFISRGTFERERRRGPGGKFRSKAEFFKSADTRAKESLLAEKFGGPPLGGGTWIGRAEASPDKFATELADAGFI